MRDLETAGIKHISVPEDYLLGRVLAKNIVDGDTGEVIANANDELTEERAGQAARSQHRRTSRPCTPTIWTRVGYISQTLRIDDTADQTAARVAIYRMMRPGEPPTEEVGGSAVQRPVLQPKSVTTCRPWAA